jgi:hypothetical protein
MVALGFGIAWFGYLEVIYGYTLLKGYNITWRSLANPVSPFQWPKLGSSIPTIPPGKVLPTSTSAPVPNQASGSNQSAG